jgi:cell division protein FtsB
MNTVLLIFVIALMVLCVLLMRRILKLEYQVYDLNEKINISDEEYVDLFETNLQLSEEIEILTEFKKIKELVKEKATIE